MDGDLGILHETPSQENWGATGGRYGGDNIQDLGFTEKSKPYWECASTYGEYEPRNGATGTLVFGLPTWTVPDDGGTQTFRRSWKKTDGHWIYEGVVTCDAIEYVDITWQAEPERWVLGVLGSELRGWYESATELTANSTAVFTFAVNPQDDKTCTPAQILHGWERTGGEIVDPQRDLAHRDVHARAKHRADLRPDRAGRFRRPGLLPPDVGPGAVPRNPDLLPMRGRASVRDFGVLPAGDGGGVRLPEAGSAYS